ncbi:O-antigen ligase family protein [Glycocaulis sp.]|uniref:O-antigen ligase family protein n=1 Tax=Glycocaulis sp. TaxID=1969725 RepID=UPI003F6F9426
MRPAISAILSEENRALWAWFGAMALTALFVPAGGLGLAASAGLFALFAVPAHTLATHLRKPGLATILAAAALGWATLSYSWSPNRNPEEVLKLALLTPLFIIVPVAAARLNGPRQQLARAAFIAAIGFILCVMAIEALTGGDMSRSYKLAVEGYDDGRTDLDIRVNTVLSRGATPAIMFAGIAIMLLWTQRSRALRLLAAAAGVITIAIALDFGVQANIVALVAAVAATAIAWRWPAVTLRLLLIGLAALILAGPLVFLVLLALVSPETGAAMPMSWEWRLEIWRFALEKIAEAPLAGHGIGAARVLEGTMELRGYEIDLLPLHAHNASLTLWLETGLAGAILCAAALVALARALPSAETLTRPVIMMIVFAVTVWAVNVVLSYGVWQEWHHGALALAIAAAFVARSRTSP